MSTHPLSLKRNATLSLASRSHGRFDCRRQHPKESVRVILRCQGNEMLADARPQARKTGSVAYYTRPPQARQDTLFPEGIR